MTISRFATCTAVALTWSCEARAVEAQAPSPATWIAMAVIGMNILALFLWFVVRVKKFDRGQAESPFGGQSASDRAVKAAMAFIRENWNKRGLNRDMAARHLGYSSEYLRRIFEQQTGVSFAGYVDRVRVDKGRELLEETDDPVEKIASACGYTTPAQFIRAFTSRIGVTPTEYRQDRRESPGTGTSR